MVQHSMNVGAQTPCISVCCVFLLHLPPRQLVWVCVKLGVFRRFLAGCLHTVCPPVISTSLCTRKNEETNHLQAQTNV